MVRSAWMSLRTAATRTIRNIDVAKSVSDLASWVDGRARHRRRSALEFCQHFGVGRLGVVILIEDRC